jgi:hypothetical protein
MRSQTSGWATGCSPEILVFRVLKDFPFRKAALAAALLASRCEAGGVIDCGTAEEDDPVTWEAPGCPLREANRVTETRRSSPTRRQSANGLTAGPVSSTTAHRRSVRPRG